jgi:hypothetical protein
MKEKQIKGYLLKSVEAVTITPMMKGMAFTQVATSVEKGPISASTFEPPAGYQKVRGAAHSPSVSQGTSSPHEKISKFQL